MRKIIALGLVMIMSVASAVTVMADDTVAVETETAVIEVQEAAEEITDAVAEEVVAEEETEEIEQEPAMDPSMVNGTCGATVEWTINLDEGILYLNGSGAMDDYASADALPWKEYADQITTVDVEPSVQYISGYTLAGLTNLTSVYIAETVKAIGENLFGGVSVSGVTVYYAGTTDMWENDVKCSASDFSGVNFVAQGDSKKNGFVNVDGVWGYYLDDVLCTSKTDFVWGTIDGKDAWWYVKSGIIDTKYTDIVNTTLEGSKDWWYIKGGKLETGTEIAHNQYGWWYCDAGKVDFSFKGLGINSNGVWYCENGKVDFNVTDVKYTHYCGEYAWWNIQGGKVIFTEGIEHNSNGWWYCNYGQVDFTYNGIAHNSNGWWKVENGKVNFNYKGFGSNSNGDWYCENGKVTFKKTEVIYGTVKGVSAWWNVKNSKVDYGTTVANNSNGWWYCTNGKVDFNYTGFASNSNGEWYCQKGKVTFNYNGKLYCNTHAKEHKIVNSKVKDIDYTGVKLAMYNKAQQYSSDTKYLILVDCTNNRVGIFEGSKGNWDYNNIGFILCATGAGGENSTIKGEFKLTTNRGYSFSGPDDGVPDYTCYYYSGFSGPYLFHSILYHYQTWNVKDASLGVDVSHGCVRLATENAKWIYENCPVGTTVITYK